VNEEYQKTAAAAGPAKRRIHVLATAVSSFHEVKSGPRSEDILHFLDGNVMLACQFVDNRFQPYDAFNPHLPPLRHNRSGVYHNATRFRLAAFLRQSHRLRGDCRFKFPSHYRFVYDIPMVATMKVKKAVLKEQYERGEI
jgi:hypothetical protein